eukprot:CAMPEP_0175916958 /NCGR_PEP_ID=MMETSP0108-20121206/11116_1 /TAXON_ID=195067 ORGANISM="Goniomonas pacifica, Strain CCMP1869" /NCGR_SAMPLE_ID=MMETSP0108 /ASSEMBLY_ACC=CAM_ASM_000204 /LENGTH=98 /DNA_ID=CAMNT_0017239529 /DNA_START=93 /DNA_END=389 /DNA_ORIENTATION=+
MPGLKQRLEIELASSSIKSVATTTTLKRNDQAQNEDEQIDIGEIHSQRTCEILIIAVGTGHRVKVHEGHAYKQHRAETGNHQFKRAYSKDTWSEEAAD